MQLIIGSRFFVKVKADFSKFKPECIRKEKRIEEI